jgi:hypothetical protein
MLRAILVAICGFGLISFHAIAAEPKTATEKQYLDLAQKHKNSNAEVAKAVRAGTTKGGVADSQVCQNLPYLCYSTCFYAQLAGGAGIGEAGKDCKQQYLH